MFTLNDIENIEVNDCDEIDYFCSIQNAINSGMWGLQGSYGRAMMDAINGGYCLLGKKAFKDYWGNVIPSRFDVVSDSKGGIDYVRNIMGEEWYKMMEII